MKVDRGINFVVLFIITLSGYIANCPSKHSCGGVYYALQGCSGVFCLYTKTKSVTIHMKAIEQYFHVKLFIMVHRVVLTSKSMVKRASSTSIYDIHFSGGSPNYQEKLFRYDRTHVREKLPHKFLPYSTHNQ